MRKVFGAAALSVFGLAALLAPALLAPANAAPPAAQPASTPALHFDFSSVKLHPTPPNSYRIKLYPHAPPFVVPTSNKFTDTTHVQDLIMEAFGVTESQIRYLPEWTRSPYGIVYDIDGQAPGGATPTPAQMQDMLQSLLADRFQLKVHWENKPKVSVYALVVDKNGPKFHEFRKDEHAATDLDPQFAGTTLFTLARFLTQNLDNPVVDGTGLPAKPYDFDIDRLINYEELTREQNTDQVAAQDYIRSTIPHELGLRLESRKESVDYLVIDRVEQPSDK